MSINVCLWRQGFLTFFEWHEVAKFSLNYFKIPTCRVIKVVNLWTTKREIYLWGAFYEHHKIDIVRRWWIKEIKRKMFGMNHRTRLAGIVSTVLESHAFFNQRYYRDRKSACESSERRLSPLSKNHRSMKIKISSKGKRDETDSRDHSRATFCALWGWMEWAWWASPFNYYFFCCRHIAMHW